MYAETEKHEGQKLNLIGLALALVASDIVFSAASSQKPAAVVDRALAPVNEPSAVLGEISVPAVESAPSVTFDKAKL